MNQLIEQLGLLLISVIANGLSALAGGGAGLLQLPALLFLGLAFSSALATHKIASIALGIGATVRHLREKRLNWRFALLILLAGLPGVVSGASLILWVPEAAARLSLGVVTIGLGIYSRLSPELGLQRRQFRQDGWHLLAGCAGLFLIGVLNGSITSGTGLFVTLWLVIWFGLDYQRAVTYTLILVGIFWNGFGAFTLAVQTPVQWSWLPALVTGALIGGYGGAHLSIMKGSRLIKRVFEWVTVIVGIALVADGLARLN